MLPSRTAMNFRIDEQSSDEDNLYVDIPGMGSVVICATEEGISVIIYPVDDAEQQAGRVYVPYCDLVEECGDGR